MNTAEPAVRRVLSFLESRPRWVLFALGGLAWITVFMADIVTPDEVDVAFFYLVPIFVFTWFAGRRPGAVAALCSMLGYLGANLLQRTHTVSAIRFWNAFLQLGFFVTFSLLVFELKRLRDHEKTLATIDTLTGAVNLRGLRERAEWEIARLARGAGPLGLALIDVDDFKAVNDTFGHAEGDAVLVSVVHEVKAILRSVALVARLGGDEFALLLPDTAPEQADVVIRRVRGALGRVTLKGGKAVTFSIGMVTFVKPPSSLDAMLQEADDLLYRVKNEGKNGILRGIRPGTEAARLVSDERKAGPAALR